MFYPRGNVHRNHVMLMTLATGISLRPPRPPHLLPSVPWYNPPVYRGTSLTLQPSFLKQGRLSKEESELLRNFPGHLSNKRKETNLLLTRDPRHARTFAFVGTSCRQPLPGSREFKVPTARKMDIASISYLTQEQAQQIDADLMGPHVGYSVDQLMELAGLSVAQAVADFHSCSSSTPAATPAAARSGPRKLLVVCGPGNNGGDGLVAARHLTHFGFDVDTWYPKPGQKDLYQRLVKQLEQHKVSVFQEEPKDFSIYTLVVDAIFGFSFTGALRPPFDDVLRKIKQSNIPVVAVDVPSGWDVEQGDVSGKGLKPVCLVSLTAPKLFAKDLELTHYVGGRFVPASYATGQTRLSLPISSPPGAGCIPCGSAESDVRVMAGDVWFCWRSFSRDAELRLALPG